MVVGSRVPGFCIDHERAMMVDPHAHISAAPEGIFRVGLTGGIGSGKSTVAEVWRSRGVHVIDLDELSRAVLDEPGPGLEEAISAFGEEFRNAHGTADRGALAALVFSDSDARALLERIVLTRVWEGVKQRELTFAQSLSPRTDGFAGLVVHDSPLLFEKGTEVAYDAIAAVLAPAEDRIARVVRSRGKSRDYVESVIAAQVSDAYRCAAADLLIANNSSQDALESRALEVLEEVEAGAAIRL